MSQPSDVPSRDGFAMRAHMRLRGRYRWQVLDERGVPEVPRNPSGFAVAPIEGVWNDNLITNFGMDEIATRESFAHSTNENVNPWRLEMAIGTGSVAPAFEDTALNNEVQRAAGSGTFPSGSVLGSLDTGVTPNEWVLSSMATRLVTVTADRNLTEFGLIPSGQTFPNGIVIRELLRDGGGVPVTVSLLNGKTLRVDHTLEGRLAAPVAGNAFTLNIEEYDATNTLVATLPHDVVHGAHVESVTSLDIIGDIASNPITVMSMWAPNLGLSTRALKVALAYQRSGALPEPPSPTDWEPGTGTSTTLADAVLTSYTPGSHTRTKQWTVATGSANFPIYGFGVGTLQGFTGNPKYLILFNDPAFYTKLPTDTLRFGLIVTWARA